MGRHVQVTEVDVHANALLLRDLLRARSAGARERSAQLYAEDAVLHWPGRSILAGTHRGRSALLRVFDHELAPRPSPLRHEYHAVLADNDQGVVLETLRGDRGGKLLAVSLATVYRFRAGRIVEVRVHSDDEFAFDDLWSKEGDTK